MKRIGPIAYHLAGLLLPIPATKIYTCFYDTYRTYLHGYGCFVANMLIFVCIGGYVALHRIVCKGENEKLWVGASLSFVYLVLAIFTNLVAIIPQLYFIDKFHIWTMLFGYFFAGFLAASFKRSRARDKNYADYEGNAGGDAR
jgi:hypothetical protein